MSLLRTASIALVAALMSVSCSLTAPSEPAKHGLTPVPGSDVLDTEGLAWTSSGALVVSVSTGPRDSFGLADLNIETGQVTPRPIPASVPRCHRQDELAPTLDRASKHVVWLRRCAIDIGGFEYGVFTAEDLQDEPEQVAVLNSRLPIRQLSVGSGRMVSSVGNLLCETIVLIASDGLESIDIEVSGPGGTFTTAFTPDPGNCDAHGIAVLPAISGDDALAFLASTQAIGQHDRLQADLEFDLYVVPSGERVARRVPLSLHAPTSLAWSPDDDALIAGGRDANGRGTWRIDPVTGSSTLVLSSALSSPAWSMDGTAFAGLAVDFVEGNVQSKVLTGPSPVGN